MPAAEHHGKYQAAVLWEIQGYDRQGEPLRGDPVEIRVQWVTGRKQVTGANSQPIAIDAQVRVNQEIPTGSHMWLGALASFTEADENEIMEVLTYNETPDARNRYKDKTIGLAFFKTTLPNPDPNL